VSACSSVAPTLPAPPDSGVEVIVAPDTQRTYEAARIAALEAGDTKLANAYWMVADVLKDLKVAREECDDRRRESYRDAYEIGAIRSDLSLVTWERDRAVAEVGRLRNVMLDAVTALENGATLDDVIVALADGCYPGSSK
jgi:hypothetical protein